MRIASTLLLASLLAACATDPDPSAHPDAGGGGKADGEGGLRYRSLDVVFTNPLCGPHAYPAPIARAGGPAAGPDLTARPANVYCKGATDAEPSGSRPGTPQTRIAAWIDDTVAGDRIFMSSLSYSDRVIGDALCRAARDRDVEVTFVLDAESARSRELVDCGGTVLLRGHQGSIGFAHVKLVMINPDGAGPGDDDPGFVRMAWGSGNISAGTHIHHENWMFTEVARDSYFVESHRCLVRALVDAAATSGKGAFTVALQTCRAAITHAPETDVRAFFIPGLDDRKAAKKALLDGVNAATGVDIAAHRFSYTALVNALAARLAVVGFRVRLVADDDLYWLAPLVGEPREVGVNDTLEATRVASLDATGGDFEVRYMETNDGEHLLHHNKFILFAGLPGGDAVMTGAPNFTGAAFEDNLENAYYITIPHVVAAYRAQYAGFWDGQRAAPDEPEPPRATRPEDMPATYPAGP